VIQEKIGMGDIILKSIGSSAFPEQHRPIGVLDVAACESQKSDGVSVGIALVHDEAPSASKRRRICR
jgi:cyclin D1/2/4, plant